MFTWVVDSVKPLGCRLSAVAVALSNSFVVLTPLI